MATSAQRAGEKAGGAGTAYAALGVQVKDAGGHLKAPQQLFEEVADAISNVENPLQRTAYAMQIFGRGGQRLLPLLAKGSSGIKQFRKRFAELGGGFSDKFVERADEVDDKLAELKISSNSFKSAIGEALLPAVSKAIDKFTDFTGWLTRVLQGSKFVQIALISLGAAAAAAGIRALIPWLPAIGTFLLFAAAALVVWLAIDDIYNLLAGNRSLIGSWIKEWYGIDAADEFVRGFNQHLEILVETIKDVGKWAMVAFKILANPFEASTKDITEFLKPVEKLLNFGNDENVFKLFAKAQTGGFAPPPLPFHADRELTDGGVKRTRGRGVNAPLSTGLAGTSKVSPEVVSPFFRSEMQRPSNVSEAAWNKVAVNQNVTVNAHTNASPADIASHVTKAIHSQNRNLRAARTGRIPKQ
jgi:hypothetical protein